MDTFIAIMSCIGINFGVIINSLSIMFIAWWLGQIGARVTNIEQAEHTKAWLKAIEDGESLSDIAYMKEKGFLK